MKTNVARFADQIPLTGMPQERPDAAISFPIYASAELPARRDLILRIPAALQRTAPGLETAWGLFTEQWLAAVGAQSALMERQGDEGTVKQNRELRHIQAHAVEALEKQGFTPPVASTEFRDENLGEIIQMISDKTKQVELDRLPTKKSEVFWAKGVKILFVAPQLMMFTKAIHFDPAGSAVFGGLLVLGAYGLASVYQLVARPIIECIASLAGKPTERFGEAPLKRAGVITQLVLFGAGFAAVVACAAALDATVIFQSTQLDRFGQKNPTAIPFSTALAIAGSFSGMLALASLAIARQERDRADIARMVEERIGRLVQKVSPAFKKIRLAEGELALETAREAEVFASARYQWIRLLTAIYLMSKNVDDDAIIRFLMIPHSPIEPSGNVCAVDATPRSGLGGRVRDFFGRRVPARTEG